MGIKESEDDERLFRFDNEEEEAALSRPPWRVEIMANTMAESVQAAEGESLEDDNPLMIVSKKDLRRHFGRPTPRLPRPPTLSLLSATQLTTGSGRKPTPSITTESVTPEGNSSKVASAERAEPAEPAEDDDGDDIFKLETGEDDKTSLAHHDRGPRLCRGRRGTAQVLIRLAGTVIQPQVVWYSLPMGLRARRSEQSAALVLNSGVLVVILRRG